MNIAAIMTYDELNTQLKRASDFSSEEYQQLFSPVDYEQQAPVSIKPLYLQLEENAKQEEKKRAREAAHQKRLAQKAEKEEEARKEKEALLMAQEEKQKVEEAERIARQKMQEEQKKVEEELRLRMEEVKRAEEVHERNLIADIKPDSLFIVANILSNLEHVPSGEILDRTGERIDIVNEIRQKAQTARDELNKANQLIRKSKDDLKRIQWNAIGKVKEEDIERNKEKEHTVQVSLSQLEAKKNDIEKEIDLYNHTITQNSKRSHSIYGFWLSKDCISADCMKQLQITIDSNSEKSNTYSYEDALLFVRRFSLLTDEHFYIPSENELFYSNGGNYSNIIMRIPHMTACIAKTKNNHFKREFGCEWAVKPVAHVFKTQDDKSEARVFYTQADKMFCSTNKPSVKFKAETLTEKNLSSDFEEWFKTHCGFRIACSENAYTRLKAVIVKQLKDVIIKYADCIKSVEYRKLFSKDSIQYINIPLSSQVYFAVKALDALENPDKARDLNLSSSLFKGTISENMARDILIKLNGMFRGKYVFDLLNTNKNAFSYLSKNNLITEGVYLYIKKG